MKGERMKKLRLYIVFKESAKLGSINNLIGVAETESNGTMNVESSDMIQQVLIMGGFNNDPAIRRRVMHEINSRYHNMIQSMSEVDLN